MARQALSHVFREGSPVGFTISARAVIDGEGNHRTPCRFNAPHKFFECLPRAGSVELVPHRRAARGVYILDCGQGGSGKHLHGSSRFGGARYSEFTIRIKKFLAGGRTREYGAVVHRAEQVRPHIDLARVAKAARSQLDVLEPFAVGAK
jgi:hypothetical protein